MQVTLTLTPEVATRVRAACLHLPEVAADIERQLADVENAAAAELAGVFMYVFPDASSLGVTKTITIFRSAELEHREVEELLERYNATSCECTPPTAVAS
jgi:hypothetical protein